MAHLKRLPALLASATLFGALAAATLASAAPPAAMTIALPGDFPRLDPSKDTSPLGFNFRLNAFDALNELQRDGSVTGRLAVSWSYSADLIEWTAKLRPNVVFHDGSKFGADDVVWTIQRILTDPTTPVRTFLRLVKTVEKVDDLTVKFTLIQPYAIFDRQMTYINMMSKTYWDKVGDTGYGAQPVGTGPYRMTQWTKDDRMVLRANPGYWRGEPAIKTATFRPIPSDAARASALMSGEIDLVPALPPSLLPQVGAAAGMKVGTAPGFRVIFVAFNVNAAPLDNPMIREAIDRGIDRESLTKNLLRGLGKPTGIMVPPMNIGYDASFKPTAFDLEAARKLVKDSGYAGQVIPLQYPANNLVMANEVAQAIAGYMTAIGLKVQLKPLEFTAFFPLWLQSKLDGMYLFAFGASGYHAESVLTTMFEKGSHSYKVNDEIDRLLKQQRTVTDLVQQKKLLGDAFRLSNADRYHVPLYDEMQAYGMKANIDYVPWPDGFVRLYDFK